MTLVHNIKVQPYFFTDAHIEERVIRVIISKELKHVNVCKQRYRESVDQYNIKQVEGWKDWVLEQSAGVITVIVRHDAIRFVKKLRKALEYIPECPFVRDGYAILQSYDDLQNSHYLIHPTSWGTIINVYVFLDVPNVVTGKRLEGDMKLVVLAYAHKKEIDDQNAVETDVVVPLIKTISSSVQLVRYSV